MGVYISFCVGDARGAREHLGLRKYKNRIRYKMSGDEHIRGEELYVFSKDVSINCLSFLSSS